MSPWWVCSKISHENTGDITSRVVSLMGVIKDKPYGILSTNKKLHKPGVWANAGDVTSRVVSLVGVIKDKMLFYPPTEKSTNLVFGQMQEM